MALGFMKILCGLLLVLTPLCNCKYTFCVITRTARYHSAEKHCNTLRDSGSEITCIIGVDRLDCLRKVSIGVADFGVLQAEEIMIASYSKNVGDILITHQIRQHSQGDWEYGVVALVDNNARITSLKDIQGKSLCHPGYDPLAFQYDWSEIFSQYFESRVVTQQCDENKTVAENRIKSLAEYFGDSCKPGSWVPAHHLDFPLKDKYKSLCSLCEIPGQCSSNDKYWGRQGALFCLSDCLGDIAWARLDDAKYHFKSGTAACSDVSILCRDGSRMPLNSSNACVWVARPNPVVAVNRQRAEKVQYALHKALETPEVNVKVALQTLLESVTAPQSLSLVTPLDYLSKVPGYLNSNTMVRCGQGSRSIRLCCSSEESKTKCAWLAAAASVYGVEPSIICVHDKDCMLSVSKQLSDVVIIPTDQYVPAIRDYKLKPLLVQTKRDAREVKYVSAVVKLESNIHTLSDLKGKRACFTSIDGVGWSSLIMALKKFDLLPAACPYSAALAQFFSEICVIKDFDKKIHNITNIRTCGLQDGGHMSSTDEDVALQCLITGGGDVAFISMDTVQKYTGKLSDTKEWSPKLKITDFHPLCDGNSTKNCFLQWATLGQVMIHPETSEVKRVDIMSLFIDMDVLFGSYNTLSSHYTFDMYSKFDLYQDLLFQDDTERLELAEQFLKKAEFRLKNYELDSRSLLQCSMSSNTRTTSPAFYLLVLLIFVMYTCD